MAMQGPQRVSFGSRICPIFCVFQRSPLRLVKNPISSRSHNRGESAPSSAPFLDWSFRMEKNSHHPKLSP
jgi:hypothetical protein